MVASDPNDPGTPEKKKRGPGRPPNAYETLTVKVSAEDLVVLRTVEDETTLAPEETIRMLAHLAIWQTPEVAPEKLSHALDEGRKSAKKG